MSRRIVFAGGAQTRALARVYRGEVAAHTGDDVIFVGTGAVGTDAARSTLMMADIVAMEIDEDGDAVPAGDLPSQATVIRIPNLYCDYLWPFAGRANPRNRGAFALPGGPYPAEHGDRFLDQMVADNVYETTAITRYKAMDIATEGELDSRLTDRSAIQARLDEASGFDLAQFIAERFRTEPLFRTRQRLTMPLAARLVDQLFGKLGVSGWREDSLKRVPFPASAQPIHPGVIAHFGLTWASANDTYPVNEEGFFTFEEFCRRYMGFVWNETLHRGIQTAKTDPAAALADLEQGLATSPDSPLGKVALKVARQASDPGHGPADPGLIIDEESYDPRAGTDDADLPLSDAPVSDAPVLDAPVLDAPVLDAPVPDAPGEDPSVQAAADAEAVAEEPVTAGEDGAEAAVTDEAEAPDFEPEADLLAVAAPEVEAPSAEADQGEASIEAADFEDGLTHHAVEDDLIAEAAPAPSPIVRPPPPPEAPPRSIRRNEQDGPKPGSTADGFTDFRPIESVQPALASPGSDLIDALPSLLPVFADLASNVDRPFGTMPEVMPPPPLRPILPPELQDEGPRPGLFARMLGRR